MKLNMVKSIPFHSLINASEYAHPRSKSTIQACKEIYLQHFVHVSVHSHENASSQPGPTYTMKSKLHARQFQEDDVEFFLPGTSISTSPSSSPSLLSFCSSSSPNGEAPMRDLWKFLYRFAAPMFGYPIDSLIMASSSSSESIIMVDPTEGPTISPISSSSSTSRGARSLRRVPSTRSSSEELVDKESGGLNRASGKVGDENGSSLKSADGNAAPRSSLLSSSNPAITNGLLGHWELELSLLSFCRVSCPSFSLFSVACCFCAASRAAS